MADKQPKSTDEGVTVEVAENKIASIDSAEELEAYAGEEAADEDGRTGVKTAYEARKAELQEDAKPSGDGEDDAEDDAQEEAEVIEVSRADLEPLAAGCAQRLQGIKAVLPNHAKLNPLDSAFEQATERLQELAGGKGKKTEVEAEELSHILTAVKRKADDDAKKRGMQQPSKDQQALIDILEPAEELDF